MFDTLAVAQQLAAGGVERDQAEVIAKAIHDGLEQGDHVTSDQFRAGIAEVRAEIANLDTRLSDANRRAADRDREPRNPAHPLDGRHRHRHRDVDRRHPASHRIGEDGGDAVLDPPGANGRPRTAPKTHPAGQKRMPTMTNAAKLISV